MLSIIIVPLLPSISILLTGSLTLNETLKSPYPPLSNLTRAAAKSSTLIS